jgi:acyl-CoA reductase-like NAD-dependent aldehyde dehydrogenase
MHRNVPQLWFEPVPWIDGKPIDRKPTEQVVNPATGQLIARVAFAESSDIEQAIASSHGAQDRWQKTSAFERGEILKRVAERLEAQRDVLARLLTAEQGKPYLQALGEVDYAASFFRWPEGFAGVSLRILRPIESFLSSTNLLGSPLG